MGDAIPPKLSDTLSPLIVLAECIQNRYQCETGLATLSSLQTINGQKLAKWSIYHESVRIMS